MVRDKGVIQMSEVSLIDGHIDNGMKDEDIIMALECCSKNGCKECKYKGKSPDCMTVLQNDAFNLINRYKAENDKLKGSELALYIRDITVKEFAERLKYVTSINIAGQKHYVIVETYFDNLVKEMTESGYNK